MKTTSGFVALCVMSAAVGLVCTTHGAPPVAWEITEGFDRPESAYYHADSGSLFISQIVGEGGKKDGKGWISKLSLDGKVIKLKWATGLNAPKGMRSVKGVLWVSDITRLVGFKIADGSKVAEVEIPDTKFLNDVATSPDGTVYVSAMATNTIYQYKDGKLEVFAKDVEKPNGLLVSGTRLLVGGWESGDKQGGHLYAIDLRTKQKTLITPKPTGNLDGIELDGRGNYLVSDWVAGKVYRISPNGSVKAIIELGKGTADHAYIEEKGLLVLPRMMDNKITAYQIASPDPELKALFNGKDLSGWKTTGNWKVEKDGSVSLTPRPGEKGWQRYGAYLTTEKKYGDFELHVEYQIPPRGNSGVYIRIEDPVNPVKTGIEVQVLDSYGQTKKLGNHDHGGIISATGPSKNMSIPAMQWNKMIVICRGYHLRVILNGEQIQDVQLDQTPVKDRKLVGYISMQDHGLPMAVRNIKIKELK